MTARPRALERQARPSRWTWKEGVRTLKGWLREPPPFREQRSGLSRLDVVHAGLVALGLGITLFVVLAVVGGRELDTLVQTVAYTKSRYLARIGVLGSVTLLCFLGLLHLAGGSPRRLRLGGAAKLRLALLGGWSGWVALVALGLILRN